MSLPAIILNLPHEAPVTLLASWKSEAGQQRLFKTITYNALGLSITCHACFSRQDMFMLAKSLNPRPPLLLLFVNSLQLTQCVPLSLPYCLHQTYPQSKMGLQQQFGPQQVTNNSSIQQVYNNELKLFLLHVFKQFLTKQIIFFSQTFLIFKKTCSILMFKVQTFGGNLNLY